MIEKILTSLVLISLICVVLVGAETSGLSSTSVGGQNSNKNYTSCQEGCALNIGTGQCVCGGGSSPECQGVEYNGNCYTNSFSVKEGDTFYTQKEIIEVTGVEGSHCGIDENGQTICTNTISSVDLKINYRCTGNICPNYESQITLIAGEETKLEFTKILLKLKGTNVNVDPSTAEFEIAFQASSCRAGCICNDNIITCPNEQEPTITTEIQTSSISGTSVQSSSGTSTQEETSTTSTISLSKTEAGGTSIQSGDVEIVTSENVSVINSKLTIQTSSGSIKEIKVMPEEVITESLKIESVKEVELITESEKAVYSISGTKKAKVIAVFPVEMKVEAKVSAETGKII